jgi:hypothetical protein
MTTRAKVMMAILAAILLCGGFGCVAVSKWMTPAQINPRAVAYVVDAGVADPNVYGGYPNLAKAEQLLADVDVAHNRNQMVWRQLMEKDDLDYASMKDVVAANVATGQSLENALFGSTGLLALLLGGTGGAILGLLRKRPGDWTEEEVQSALKDADTVAVKKDYQMADIVKAMEIMKDHLPEGVWDTAKKFIKMDNETKETVAQIKATL